MSNSSSANWNPLIGLVSELKQCDEHGITTAAVAMSYICIDTLAGLARAKDKEQVTRSDFKAWVDLHLKADPSQPYQYRGKDVYAARCALLHAYGSEASLHQDDPDTIKFGYHDGGKHYYDSAEEKSLALIGTKSFVNDVVHAVESFTRECQNDVELRARVEARLGRVLNMMPFPK